MVNVFRHGTKLQWHGAYRLQHLAGSAGQDRYNLRANEGGQALQDAPQSVYQ